MTQKLDNPQAFPHVVPDDWRSVTEGMTLRDYFAAHCPIGFETYLKGLSPAMIEKGITAALESYVTARFQYADAMLKAREATHD